MVVLVIIILLILFWCSGLPLLKKGEKREFFVFTLLFLLGSAYAVGAILDLKLPNPTDLIIKTHRPAFQLLGEFLPILEE